MDHETYNRWWSKIKQYSEIVLVSVVAVVAWLMAACVTVGGISLILLFLFSLIVIAYSGRALIILLVGTFVILFASLIMYQDLTLFTIISNYLAQYL